MEYFIFTSLTVTLGKSCCGWEKDTGLPIEWRHS
jgi:hypothetical protein